MYPKMPWSITSLLNSSLFDSLLVVDNLLFSYVLWYLFFGFNVFDFSLIKGTSDSLYHGTVCVRYLVEFYGIMCLEQKKHIFPRQELGYFLGNILEILILSK